MMGTKERSFAPLCNRSIENLVPADMAVALGALEKALPLLVLEPALGRCSGRQSEPLSAGPVVAEAWGRQLASVRLWAPQLVAALARLELLFAKAPK